MDKEALKDCQPKSESQALKVLAFIGVIIGSSIFFSLMAAFLIVVSELLKEFFSNTPLRLKQGTFLAYFIAVPLTILGIWLVNKFGFKRLKNYLGKSFYIAVAIGFVIVFAEVLIFLTLLFKIAAG